MAKPRSIYPRIERLTALLAPLEMPEPTRTEVDALLQECLEIAVEKHGSIQGAIAAIRKDLKCGKIVMLRDVCRRQRDAPLP